VSNQEEPVDGQPLTQGGADTAQPDGSAAADADNAPLLALVDRLSAILDKGELGELEMRAGGTTIVVRSQAALERQAVFAPAGGDASTAEAAPAPPASGSITAVGAAGAASAATAAPGVPAPAKPSVKAPLTGIYYGAPSPGATPYVSVGDHVQAGQIIGLIEAMKLFNEIKSDLSGRVTKVCAENGQLVKAKQPLIEVERA
jgi:acetyl-CoA carboxylase biotin carboxyl carrier protein